MPFIHLPPGHVRKKSSATTAKREESIAGDSCASNDGASQSGQARLPQKANKTMVGRDRATSDGAINALLAMGSDQ